MNFIRNHHEYSKVGREGTCSHLDSREKVCRAVSASKGRVAHRAGKDDRLRFSMRDIHQIRTFFNRVGPLGDNHPRHALGESFTDQLTQSIEVIEGKRRSR